MAFRLDVTVATKNSLWPLATIVEDLDLLGGVVGPLGEPLHVLSGDLVPGHRHHLGSPRVRAGVEIADHQFTLSCQVLCLTHSWNNPSYVLVVSEFNVSHFGIIITVLWTAMGGGTGGNAVASVFIGDRMQVILTQQIYPIQSIYALDTASSDIANGLE